MPKISEVIMVKNMAGSNCPPARSSSAVASFRPTPVLVTTPMMIPAVAQAISTPSTPLEPLIRPFTKSFGVMRVLLRRHAQTIVRAMAYSAARMGV